MVSYKRAWRSPVGQPPLQGVPDPDWQVCPSIPNLHEGSLSTTGHLQASCNTRLWLVTKVLRSGKYTVVFATQGDASPSPLLSCPPLYVPTPSYSYISLMYFSLTHSLKYPQQLSLYSLTAHCKSSEEVVHRLTVLLTEH